MSSPPEGPSAGGHLPTLCFVGSLLGRHRGRVLAQAETAAALLRQAGYPVRLTSSVRHPVLRAVRTGADLIRWRHHVDVVIVDVFSGLAFAHAHLAAALATQLDLRLILFLHGGNLPAYAAAHPERVDKVLARARAIVAPSNYIAAVVRKRGYEVAVIPNVVLLDGYLFRPRQPVRPRVLWMRAFEELYQPDLALDAFALVRKEMPDAILTMAGQDSGLLGATRRRAEELGLGESVRFPGYLDWPAKRRALAEHDVFLNTPHIDNMPVSVLEAAASGLSIVATAVGGIPEMFPDGRAALLSPDGDSGALSRAILRLTRDPALARSLAAEARLVAEQSDWSQVKPRWDDLINAVYS